MGQFLALRILGCQTVIVLGGSPCVTDFPAWLTTALRRCSTTALPLVASLAKCSGRLDSPNRVLVLVL